MSDTSHLFKLKTGMSRLLTFTFTNKLGAINLTGATTYFAIKRVATDTDADALLFKTITSYDTPEAGILSILLTATDTNGLPLGTYVGAVKAIFSGGTTAGMDFKVKIEKGPIDAYV